MYGRRFSNPTFRTIVEIIGKKKKKKNEIDTDARPSAAAAFVIKLPSSLYMYCIISYTHIRRSAAGVAVYNEQRLLVKIMRFSRNISTVRGIVSSAATPSPTTAPSGV